MNYQEKVSKGHLWSQVYMALFALITLLLTGPSKLVPYHFNFRLEPGSFAPALITVLILPGILAFAYFAVSRNPENIDQQTYRILGVCLFLVLGGQTFLCIYAINA